MNFSLKSISLIGQWVPGVAFLAFIWGAYNDWGYSSLPTTSGAVVGALLISVMAFVVGVVIDAVRNSIIEEILDRFDKHRMEWEQLLTVKQEEFDRFESYFFSYYILDWNLALGSILAIVILIVKCPNHLDGSLGWYSLILLFVAILLICDAFSLRREIKAILDRWKASADLAKK